MTEPNKMLVTKDGIRVSPEDAEKFGLETEGTVKLRGSGDRPRTTTAVGRAAVKDDKRGRVITSAAERGADDGGTPYGENVGLGDATTSTPKEVPVAPPAESNPSANAPDDTAAADKEKSNDGTPADQEKRSGDDNGDAGDQPKNRARRAAGH
jgi:hypothetical protein